MKRFLVVLAAVFFTATSCMAIECKEDEMILIEIDNGFKSSCQKIPSDDSRVIQFDDKQETDDVDDSQE